MLPLLRAGSVGWRFCAATLMVGLHLSLRKDELHFIAHEGDLLGINAGANQRGTVGVEKVGEEAEVLTRGGLQVLGVGLLDVTRSPLRMAGVEVILRLWTVGEELAIGGARLIVLAKNE